jgi:hypothetical protein
MTESKATQLSIYQIIPKVREEVGVIRKDQEASGGARYKYRGTDAIINALAPVLNKYGVFTTVEDFDFSHSSELTATKKVLTTVTLRKRVRFYGPAGDYVESVVAGENSDYSDKATGGASTYAYRYALVQTFVLPTDEDDPDGTYKEREAPAAAIANTSSAPTADPLKATQDRVVALAKAAADKHNDGATGTGIVKEIAAANWPDKDFVKDVWKSVGALEIVEQKLKADAAA